MEKTTFSASSISRMAGNIASGLTSQYDAQRLDTNPAAQRQIARVSVNLALLIVEELGSKLDEEMKRRVNAAK